MHPLRIALAGQVITGSLRALNTHGLMKEGDLDAYRRGMRLATERHSHPPFTPSAHPALTPSMHTLH